MRYMFLLTALIGLLGGLAIAPARASLTLHVTVGFDGYYRPNTLVPIMVEIDNTGDTLRGGEFRVFCDDETVLADQYRFPLNIPRNARQRHFLYVIPTHFARMMRVEYWLQGHATAMATFNRCQEVYEQERLLVVVGGSGSSLGLVGGQSMTMAATPPARPWDYAGTVSYRQRYYGGSPGSTNGTLRIAHVGQTTLPDNPEAYGSIGTLALMSDVTENTLPFDAQQAIPLWLVNGGHLLVAGGGVRARLDAPFFTGLTFRHGTLARSMKALTLTGVGSASIARFGAGWLSALSFDPDTITLSNTRQATQFFIRLLAREPETPLANVLWDTLKQAVTVRHLKPPNLTLIVVYLLVYLVLLVPVNYFVLRKLDRRELAWVTTPAIVVLFTVGAYGIGYLTKGHRLVMNMVSLVETTAGQSAAEAVSQVLIFSPARTTYRMALGEGSLVARETMRQESYNRNQDTAVHLPICQAQGELTVDRVTVNMWDFRQFTTVHRVKMGKGITADLTDALPITGTVTNNTPYHFTKCLLYCNGSSVAEFALAPNQTLRVQQARATLTPQWDENAASIYADFMENFPALLGNGKLSRGLVLLGFTDRMHLPLRLDQTAPTSSMQMVMVHL